MLNQKQMKKSHFDRKPKISQDQKAWLEMELQAMRELNGIPDGSARRVSEQGGTQT